MKEVEIDETIRRDPKLYSAVEHATTLLEEEIGPSSGSVSAEWREFGADQRIPAIRLKISDWTGSAMIHFQRSMLENLSDPALRLSFVRLWGDLLQERSHKQVESLNKMIESMTDE